MKILAIEHEQPHHSADDFHPHLRDEALRAWELYAAGVIRELYFDETRRVAIVVLESETLDTARDVLAALPLVQRGLIAFELYPLSAYTGFARLFMPERTGNN